MVFGRVCVHQRVGGEQADLCYQKGMESEASRLGRLCCGLDVTQAAHVIGAQTTSPALKESLLSLVPKLFQNMSAQTLCTMLSDNVLNSADTTSFFLEARYQLCILTPLLSQLHADLNLDTILLLQILGNIFEALWRMDETTKRNRVCCDIIMILQRHLPKKQELHDNLSNTITINICDIWRKLLTKPNATIQLMATCPQLFQRLALRLQHDDYKLSSRVFDVVSATNLDFGNSIYTYIDFATSALASMTRTSLMSSSEFMVSAVKFFTHLSERPRYQDTAVESVDQWHDLAFPQEFGTIFATLLSCNSVYLILRLHNSKKLELFIRNAMRYAAEPSTAFCADWRVVRARLRVLWPSKVQKVLNTEQLRSKQHVTDYRCPISLMQCIDPVLASDGHTYERDALMTYMSSHANHETIASPVTKQPLGYTLISNFALYHY